MIVPMTASSLFSRRGGGPMPLAAKRGWETGSETLPESLIPDREIVYPWLSHNDTPWDRDDNFHERKVSFFQDVMRSLRIACRGYGFAISGMEGIGWMLWPLRMRQLRRKAYFGLSRRGYLQILVDVQ
jgi:hypothetical protein